MNKITLNYSESIVKVSVKAFWWKQIGKSFLVALSFIAIVLFYSLYKGERSWFIGMLGTILFIGVALLVGSYFVYYYRSMHRLQRMGNQKAILEFNQETFRITSDLGSTEIKWSLIKKIQILKQCWLIYFTESETMTLPIANLNTESREKMLRIIEENSIDLG
jgi:hypothetical protein